MTDFTIRPLDPDSERELNHLCVFSMMTLWESRQEMRVDPASIEDFGYKAHRHLFRTAAANPAQRCLIALDGEANIVGHSVVVVRSLEGQRYGYFWSRYVLPKYRRKGLGSRFLRLALDWFSDQGVAWAEVHIHTDNATLRRLFEREGFSVVDRRVDRWTYLVLRKELG